MLFESAYKTPLVSRDLRRLQISARICRPKEAYLVRVDWMDLELAFRDNTGTQSYLDRSTGEVLSIVEGFDDEAELREAVAADVERHVEITPVSLSYSKKTMRNFIKNQGASIENKETLDALKASLGSTVGILTRSLDILREDPRALALYHRFEQQCFWDHVQNFLFEQSVVPSSAPPAPELFVEDVRLA